MSALKVRQMEAHEASEFLRLAADEGVAQSLESNVVAPEEAGDLYQKYEALTPGWRPLDSDLVLVGEVDGTRVGGVWARKEERRGEAYATGMHISIYPEFRRQGYARALVTQAFAYARELWGVSRVLSSVLPSNIPSHDLVRSLGGVHLYTVYTLDIGVPGKSGRN